MIELSVMEHGRDFPQLMRTLLDQFECETRLKVNLRILTWENAWSELVRVGLYSDGPQVSEIGSTWLSEFVGMGALRPFGLHELVHNISREQYLPSAWVSAMVSGGAGTADTMWAVPWVADTRVVYYRPEAFAQAGVDPHWAFQTPQTLLEAGAQFQAARLANPIVLPSRFTHITLHNIASWLWGSGGDFLTPDRRQVQFDTPTARAAFYAYFDLIKYMSPSAQGLDDHGMHASYRGGEAAAVLTGTWLQGTLAPEVAALTQHEPAAGYALSGRIAIGDLETRAAAGAGAGFGALPDQRGSAAALCQIHRAVPEPARCAVAGHVPAGSIPATRGGRLEAGARFSGLSAVGAGGKTPDRNVHDHLGGNPQCARTRYTLHRRQAYLCNRPAVECYFSFILRI